MKFTTLAIWVSGVAGLLFARGYCSLDYDTLRLRALLDELTERYSFPDELDEAGKLGRREFSVLEERAGEETTCGVFLNFLCEGSPQVTLTRHPLQAYPNQDFQIGLSGGPGPTPFERRTDSLFASAVFACAHSTSSLILPAAQILQDLLEFEVTPGAAGKTYGMNEVMSQCGVAEGSVISVTMKQPGPPKNAPAASRDPSPLANLDHLNNFAGPPTTPG